MVAQHRESLIELTGHIAMACRNDGQTGILGGTVKRHNACTKDDSADAIKFMQQHPTIDLDAFCDGESVIAEHIHNTHHY